MDLKQRLIDFGCGSEFVDIALGYAQFYQPDQEIETFIEYVEEAHAKVEEIQEPQIIDPKMFNESGLIEVMEGSEEF